MCDHNNAINSAADLGERVLNKSKNQQALEFGRVCLNVVFCIIGANGYCLFGVFNNSHKRRPLENGARPPAVPELCNNTRDAWPRRRVKREAKW